MENGKPRSLIVTPLSSGPGCQDGDERAEL